MRNRLIFITYNLVVLIAISGCAVGASSSQTYTTNGKQGYTINCSGSERNWGMCYEKAGNKCQNKGYDIVDVLGEQATISAVKSAAGLATSTTSTTYNRIMVIECKEPEETPAISNDNQPAVERILNSIKEG